MPPPRSQEPRTPRPRSMMRLVSVHGQYMCPCTLMARLFTPRTQRPKACITPRRVTYTTGRQGLLRAAVHHAALRSGFGMHAHKTEPPPPPPPCLRPISCSNMKDLVGKRKEKKTHPVERVHNMAGHFNPIPLSEPSVFSRSYTTMSHGTLYVNLPCLVLYHALPHRTAPTQTLCVLRLV